MINIKYSGSHRHVKIHNWQVVYIKNAYWYHANSTVLKPWRIVVFYNQDIFELLKVKKKRAKLGGGSLKSISRESD